MSSITVRVDDKGRLTLPREMRDELNLTAGTTMYLKREGDVLQLKKGEDPFDVLARAAHEEFKQGRTRNLRDYARDRGIESE